jgi:hypothetical protein
MLICGCAYVGAWLIFHAGVRASSRRVDFRDGRGSFRVEIIIVVRRLFFQR